MAGGNSFLQSSHWPELEKGLQTKGIGFKQASIEGEPSPRQIDELVARYHGDTIGAVVGIGGGSVLDAAKAVAEGFMPAYAGGGMPEARQGRAAMAYAALLSGITLAQVGLGSVHGLAQPLGSVFPLPHGVACGTTVAEATRVNIECLRERLPQSPALVKYARVGRLLCDEPMLSVHEAGDALVEVLRRWTEHLALPRLGHYGVTEADIPLIVANSRGNSMRTNPVELDDEAIAAIVRARL